MTGACLALLIDLLTGFLAAADFFDAFCGLTEDDLRAADLDYGAAEELRPLFSVTF